MAGGKTFTMKISKTVLVDEYYEIKASTLEEAKNKLIDRINSEQSYDHLENEEDIAYVHSTINPKDSIVITTADQIIPYALSSK